MNGNEIDRVTQRSEPLWAEKVNWCNCAYGSSLSCMLIPRDSMSGQYLQNHESRHTCSKATTYRETS